MATNLADALLMRALSPVSGGRQTVGSGLVNLGSSLGSALAASRARDRQAGQDARLVEALTGTGIAPAAARSAVEVGAGPSLLAQALAPPSGGGASADKLRAAGVAPGSAEARDLLFPPARPTGPEAKLAAAGIEPGTPEARDFLGRPSTSVNVNTGEKFRTESEKRAATRLADLQFDTLPALQAERNSIDALGGLLDRGVETGPVRQAMARAAAIASDFGMDVAPGDFETFEAFANRLALDQVGKLKGQTSDRELAFVERSTIDAGRSTEGNRRVLEMLRRINDRGVEEAEFEAQVIQTTGRPPTREMWRERFPPGSLFPNAPPVGATGEGAGAAIDRPASTVTGRVPQAPGEVTRATGPVPEGATATNPNTGDRLIFQGGRWVPFNG